mgnify:FL=1
MVGIDVRKTQICGGDCLVSGNGQDLFCTVLGSCVAACIYDPVAGLGGMNHYLLPHNKNGKENTRYGNDALPRLLKQLYSRGADRYRLVAKIYGGARILSKDADIGQMNIDFARRFLWERNIPIVDADHGGLSARWIDFHPASGWTFIKAATREAAVIREDTRVANGDGVDPHAGRALRAAR